MRLERKMRPQVFVNLTPLIDVVLQLVIFFMITSVFRTAPGIALNLPESGTAEEVAISEIRIIAISPGEIFINDESCSLETLPGKLDTLLRAQAKDDPRVIVEGDAKAPYELLISILDVARSKGIVGVDLLTRERRDP